MHHTNRSPLSRTSGRGNLSWPNAIVRGKRACRSPTKTQSASLKTRFNAAWDAGTIPKASPASLADDAQFITVNGAWTTTRAGFRDLMARLHGANGPYRTRDAPDAGDEGDLPRARHRHPAFAVLDRGRGPARRAQPGPRESVGTRVVRKIDGRWRIVATQNTDVRQAGGTRVCTHIDY